MYSSFSKVAVFVFLLGMTNCIWAQEFPDMASGTQKTFTIDAQESFVIYLSTGIRNVPKEQRGIELKEVSTCSSETAGSISVVHGQNDLEGKVFIEVSFAPKNNLKKITQLRYIFDLQKRVNEANQETNWGEEQTAEFRSITSVPCYTLSIPFAVHQKELYEVVVCKSTSLESLKLLPFRNPNAFEVNQR